MSPNSWNHAICDVDFFSRNVAEDWADVPVRLRATDAAGEVIAGFHSEPCCWCGQPTRGIYVREQPSRVPHP